MILVVIWYEYHTSVFSEPCKGVVTRSWHFVQGVYNLAGLSQPCMMVVKWLFK